MKLSVKISVIADLMTFSRNAADELRPQLCVCAEYEEGRLDIAFRERV